MKYYLKTKDECDAIAKKNPAFHSVTRVVNGFEVAIFDYRLASITDFIEDEGQELRGLTFVFNPEAHRWERHLLLQKFHNLNETKFNDDISWMLEDLKDQKITRVQNKEDGSIVSPVMFPDGSIVMKSKTSFGSDQAKMAQEYFNSHPIMQEEVSNLLKNNLVPIFELVSPKNQIVLSYEETELILLQVRDNLTGEYKNQEELNWISTIMSCRTAEVLPKEYFNFEFLQKKQKTEEGIEGYVVTLESGQMLKMKTMWYLQLHRLCSPNQFQMNHLVETIVEGNFDDVVSQLNEGPKKETFIELESKITNKFNLMVAEFSALRRSYYIDFNKNRKEFALKNRTEPLFTSVMNYIGRRDIDINESAEIAVKEYILKKCSKLKSAELFVEGL